MTADARPLFAVLGASGGIGSALCRRLASGGARLVIGARREEPLRVLAAELDATPVAVDARSFRALEEFFAEVDRVGSPLAGVACCVGSLLLKSAHQTTQDEYDETIASNLTAAFATLRAAAPRLRTTGGSIVLVSSAAASVGLAHHEAIAAAKAGVAGLATSAAATYASWKIRVNAVAPGLVDTPLTASITGNELMRNASTAMHALGRIGRPEDVASLIAWLLGDESNWVTGQLFAVDGGLSRVRARPTR